MVKGRFAGQACARYGASKGEKTEKEKQNLDGSFVLEKWMYTNIGTIVESHNTEAISLPFGGDLRGRGMTT